MTGVPVSLNSTGYAGPEALIFHLIFHLIYSHCLVGGQIR
jgi:hypothetical protein